jgi:hypothetical protein
LSKCLISDTGIHRIQDDLKDFVALVPTEKVLEITLDYLHKALVYIQSEEFPKIHKIVEYLKKYKDVSAFTSMFLSFNLTEKLFVLFQLVSELLFSSVPQSSVIKV